VRLIYEQWAATLNENAVLSTIVNDVGDSGFTHQEFLTPEGSNHMPHCCNNEWAEAPGGVTMVRNAVAGGGTNNDDPMMTWAWAAGILFRDFNLFRDFKFFFFFKSIFN